MLRRLLSEEPARAALDFPEGFAGGIAHRLDISTSGALLVADSPEELLHIREAFASGTLEKTYLLWARRKAPWTSHQCSVPLAHDRRRKARMTPKRGQNTPHRGKWLEAETHFEHLEGRLYRARMRTGVMHQIRVHAAFVGIPLEGYSMYGGGQPPEARPTGVPFLLHHMGLEGPGVRTEPVALPTWAAGIRTTDGRPT